jgi:fucose permease
VKRSEAPVMIVLGLGALAVAATLFWTSADLTVVSRGYAGWLVVGACSLGGLGCLIYGIIASRRGR